MSTPKEFFKKRGITNPEAHGQGEINLWLQIEPILIDLMEELKKNGKVKTSFYQEEIDHFKNMLDTNRQVNLSNILLGSLFDSLPKCENFLKATSAFGFNEDRVVNLYIQNTVYASILDTELFKALCFSISKMFVLKYHNSIKQSRRLLKKLGKN